MFARALGSSKTMDIILDESCTKEATTWVLKAPNCGVPYYHQALEAANVRNVAIGVHHPTRRVVLHFDVCKSSREASRVFQMILGKGGAVGLSIDECKVLDRFHAESWGLIKLSPSQKPISHDKIVESDLIDLSSDVEYEDHEVDLDNTLVLPLPDGVLDVVTPDIFALALVSNSQVVVVPTWQEAQSTSTPEYDSLLSELIAAGPVDQRMVDRLMPRGRDHIKAVKDRVRGLAKNKVAGQDICWINRPPPCLRVYTKATMSVDRRVEWIVWRAKALKVPLNAVSFMSFFKQIYAFPNDVARKAAYLAAMAHWSISQGKTFTWSDLTNTTRTKILDINSGKVSSYCVVCQMVMKTTDPDSAATIVRIQFVTNVIFPLSRSQDRILRLN